MLLIGLIVIITAFYCYLTHIFNYWKSKKVPHPAPSLLFGNIGSSLTLKKSVGQIYNEIYNAFPDCLYVGYYKIRKPGIILRDPQLIRDVLVKDFNSFHDNEVEIDEDVDPIGARNAFSLKGERWKTVRSHITPCFTPKKLKGMFVLVEDAAKKLVQYIQNEPDATKPDGLESRELFAKFATEVVASCAFGLEANVFTNPNCRFREMGKKIFEPTLQTVINMYLLMLAPSLSRFLKVGFISKPVIEYFLGIVRATIKYREENNLIRNDFLDFMIDLKKKSLEYKFTEIDITAQAVGFFTDGFETSSAVMSYTFHELASNPEILAKLQNEIDEAFSEKNRKIDFDTIINLQYLDAVINEGLRMHPSVFFLMRMCTKPFTFPPPRVSGKDVEVEVGTPIIIPACALHYNPQYFKNPNIFDPDRFLPENKDSIIKGTFLPFGDGSRSCLGQRFALMQIKTVIVHILLNYDVKVGRKTVLPLEVDPKYMVPHAKGGLWLNFYKRQLE